MWCMHPDLLAQIAATYRVDQMRQVRAWRLLREAGLVRRKTWARPGCRLLYHVDRQLANVGHWLECCGHARAA